MKKKIIVVLLISTSIILSACGKDNASSLVHNSDTIEQGDTQIVSEKVEDEEKIDIDSIAQEIKEDIIEALIDKDLEISDETLLIEKPVKYLNYWDEKTYEAKIKYSTQGLAIINEGYERLQEVLDEKAKTNYEKLCEDYESAKEFFVENESSGYDIVWSNENESIVTRADKNVFSFYEKNYSYLGGAHPSSYLMGYNYDSKSGEAILLEDIVSDYDGLYQTVINYFKNDFEYKEGLFEEYEQTIYNNFYNQSIDEYGVEHKVNWYVDNANLYIYFNEYDIGPYAMGAVKLTFPYKEYANLLKAEVFSQEDYYVRRIEPWETVSEDIDNDGKLEQVQVVTEEIEPGMDGILLMVSVTDDGIEKSFSKEEWLEANQIYLIKNKIGKYYLYVNIEGYDNFHNTEIIDLNGDIPKLIETVDGLWGNDLTNIDSFYLSTRDYLLGTYLSASLYYVGDDGLPVRVDDKSVILSYDVTKMFDEGFTRQPYTYLTLKRDITGEDQYILSGTKWQPIMTTDEHVTLVSPNGKKLDLKYEKNKEAGWGYMINGVNQDELFDGVLYAG